MNKDRVDRVRSLVAELKAAHYKMIVAWGEIKAPRYGKGGKSAKARLGEAIEKQAQTFIELGREIGEK